MSVVIAKEHMSMVPYHPYPVVCSRFSFLEVPTQSRVSETQSQDSTYGRYITLHCVVYTKIHP